MRLLFFPFLLFKLFTSIAAAESVNQCRGFYSPTARLVSFQTTPSTKAMIKNLYVQLHQAKYDYYRSSALVHFLYAHVRKIGTTELFDLIDESPDLDTRETVLSIYIEANLDRLTVNEIESLMIVSPYYETKESIAFKFIQKYRYTLTPGEFHRLAHLVHNETVKGNLFIVYFSDSFANP